MSQFSFHSPHRFSCNLRLPFFFFCRLLFFMRSREKLMGLMNALLRVVMMIWQNIFHLFLFYGRQILFSSRKAVVENGNGNENESEFISSVEVNLLALCQNKKIRKNLNVNEKTRKNNFFQPF